MGQINCWIGYDWIILWNHCDGTSRGHFIDSLDSNRSLQGSNRYRSSSIQRATFKMVSDYSLVLINSRCNFCINLFVRYFLFATTYFLYGESLLYYCKEALIVDALFYPLAQHHRFISFSIYTIGIVAFVLNLRKGHYKFQFSQLAFTHMVLLFVVFQANFIACSIFEGLFWFVLPITLVICNDIMAYFFGFFFGRTPLIKLSPKKTWEGFWGALFSTIIFGFFFSGFLSKFPYLVCPVKVSGHYVMNFILFF